MNFIIDMQRCFVPPARLWIMLAFLIGLDGCTTTSVYEPEHLAGNDTRALTVHAKDGRRIRLAHGEYVVAGGLHGSVTGIGRITTNSVSNSTARWEGTIAFDEIEFVTVTEANLFGVATIGIFIGAAALFAFLLVVGPHLSWN